MSHLRVIEGGRQDHTCWGTAKVVAAPRARPPFGVDAVVVEEDRFCVLSAPPVVRDVRTHPIRLMTGLMELEPAAIGSIRMIRANPTRVLAIVNDLDCQPTTRPEWVRGAVSAMLAWSRAEGVRRLGVELLGSVHGGLDPAVSLRILEDAISAHGDLERVWLVTPAGREYDLLA